MKGQKQHVLTNPMLVLDLSSQSMAPTVLHPKYSTEKRERRRNSMRRPGKGGESATASTTRAIKTQAI